MNKFKKVIIYIILGMLVFTGIAYCSNNGELISVWIDLSVLEDENPVRRELNIEKANTAEVIVTEIKWDNLDPSTVYVKFEEYPEIFVILYLSKKDTSRIDVGDIVTVKGNIKYYESNSSLWNHHIVIGDAIAVEPYTFPAKLISISKLEE